MKASQALLKLKQAINIEYYIGKPAADLITKACEDKELKKPNTPTKAK